MITHPRRSSLRRHFPSGALVLLVALGTTLSAAADVTVFRDVDVFDGEKIQHKTTVVVRDGLIDSIGPTSKAPADAQTVDGAGCTLLPGLIDCHTHTFVRTMLQQSLVFGVTTEFDMFCDHKFAAEMRKEQKDGKALDRADFLSAGTLVTAAGGHGTEYGLVIPTIDSPEGAQAFVDARIEEGSDYIKLVYDNFSELGRSMPTLNKETVAAVIAAAHNRHKLAVVHVLAREAARDVIAAGADALVHLFIDEPADESLVKLFVDRKAFVIPTLSVLRSACGSSAGPALIADTDLNPYLSPEDIQSLKGAFPQTPKTDYAAARETVRKLKAAGVPILAGTDAPNPGTTHGASIHGELELLVEAGLTPAEALTAATSTPATKFGLTDRGRIAPGRSADLLLVRGDPTADIRATRKIVGVWKHGKAADRKTYLNELQARKEALANVREQPAPPGSESGVVSDFEAETLTCVFGSGWSESTDSFVGGKSKTALNVTKGGANGSRGALTISGTIDDKPQPRWAGAIFYPGKVPMTPANLSSKKALSFWTKGDARTYSIMIFAQSRGYTPIMKTFVAPTDWKQIRFALSDFDGCDGSDIMGIFFGGGNDTGDFSLQLDDVRFE